tara:strand:+ start:449 stop:1645 length:1197 start_codon:yes stop_codon:yes gene_type:complete
MSKDLFLEINDNNFLFVVGEYDESLNFKILKKVKEPSSGVKFGKIVDLEKSSLIVKKCIDHLENELNYIFKEVNIIINFDNYECLNVTGFKRLNGDQLLKEDIFFILNDLKRQVSENEIDKTILHLFNTNYSLDNNDNVNLPIGLSGNFYSHHLTFFLAHKNDLNNFKLLMDKCNLKINRFNIKNYLNGIKIINSDKNDTFLKISIGKEKSYVQYFYNSSFCYYQSFNFGSNIIKRDISKVCSLNNKTTNNITSNLILENFDNLDKKFLEKDFFLDEKFRKISLKLLFNIIDCRIEELISLIFFKNINLKNIKNEVTRLYFNLEDILISESINKIFEKTFIKKNSSINLKSEKITQNDEFEECNVSAELSKKGWTREALPVIQSKKSIISRIFSLFFD